LSPTAAEPQWQARRSGWEADVQRASSTPALARLLLDLEAHTKWAAVRESWRKDRDGWVGRVGALGPAASGAARAAAPAPAAAAPASTPAGGPGAALAAENVVGAWKLDEARSKAAPDGNTAGLMNRVVLKPDGSFEALYGTKGTWRLDKGRLVVRYETVAEDRAASLDGKHLKFPSPAHGDRFCYLVR
jgi:hypothetical protein